MKILKLLDENIDLRCTEGLKNYFSKILPLKKGLTKKGNRK